MAFSDADIAGHLRKIGLDRGATTTRYAAIGIPDTEHPGEGKEPHMAKLRRENQAVFTLEDTKGCGWMRLSDVAKR